MPNIITIDPSLTCTAVVVNDNVLVFASPHLCWNKNHKFNKWFELADEVASIFVLSERTVEDNYSTSEIAKLVAYQHTIDTIVFNIKAILPEGDTKIFIEGYSYSSQAGPLIDLVTFGTLLRHKLLEISSNITVVSPMSLKSAAAKLTYPAIEKGKKVKKYEYRNFEGVAGGKFTKHEMLKSLIENDSLKGKWISLLKEHSEELLAMKHIPKPFEDINDAKLMYEVALANKY
jgi:hypothetical protein